MLVLGTPAMVYPAAGFPVMAKKRGATLVEINTERTNLTPLSNISLRGKVSKILPRLVASFKQG